MDRRIAVLVLAFGLAASACGGGAKPDATSEPRATPELPTPSPTPSTTVTVTPESARLGTSFALKADGFAPGEKVTFKFDQPGGKTFTGQPHVATATGEVIASYKPAAAGDYTVTAQGANGATPQAHFTVTASGVTATTRPGASPTHRVTPKPTTKATTAPKSSPGY